MKRLSHIGLKTAGIGSILTVCRITLLGSIAFYGGLFLMILGAISEERQKNDEN